MIAKITSEKVLLSLTLLSSICIIPFSLLRWYHGEITLAILDAIISITLFTFYIYIFFTRNYQVARYLIAIFISIAFLISAAINGQAQILWISPVIISVHYLIPIKPAGLLNLVVLTIMLSIIYPHVSLIYFITTMATSGLMAVLLYVMFRSYHSKHLAMSLLATIDPLTSAGNRRALGTQLSIVLESQRREKYDMCLILLDLDDFKRINDVHGHAVGDEILINVCTIAKAHTRALDGLYRYGGDEFIIMPLSMNLTKAKQLAEKIRSEIEIHQFVRGIKITLSIGVSQYQLGDTPQSWISRADSYLYKAKNNGRNMIY